jgi:hypothetical protein
MASAEERGLLIAYERGEFVSADELLESLRKYG